MNPEIRLAAFCRAEIGRPFEWGETNCVALALRAIDAMHHTRYHATHAHHMRTPVRAAAWARSHGVRGLVDQMVAEGLTEIAPAYAQDGDILLGTTTDGQISAHVVVGARVLSATQADGVLLMRRSAVSPASTLAAGWRAA